MSTKQVVVGKRHYDLEPLEDGKWSVSRGGIPTGFVRRLGAGNYAVEPLSDGDEAIADLQQVVDEAKKAGFLD